MSTKWFISEDTNRNHARNDHFQYVVKMVMFLVTWSPVLVILGVVSTSEI